MVIILSAIALIPLVTVQWKGLITVAVVMVTAILSSILAFHALTGERLEYVCKGSLVTGIIPVRIDALSGWFMIIINFTFITGAFYGL